VSERYFTVDEANDLLTTVRPLAEKMVAHRRALARTTARRARLVTQIAGNGGALDPKELNALQGALDEEAAAVVRCVEELQALGVLVKDLDRGLVDFPALRDDEEVLLCWQVGEDEIEYWHGVDEGFAGRKPI
jgi:hypothetical protein